MKIALFDLDHTLVDCDSELEWCRFLVARGQHYMDRMERYYEEYGAGELDIDEYMAFMFQPLQRVERGRHER